MIDAQTKQKILDTANIVEVVSDFVRLKKAGADYKGLCPFHSDRRPSFSVSPSRNICKCFSCGEGGSPVHFIMKHEQLSYGEALRYLAKKYNIKIEEREETAEERAAANERESLFILNSFSQKYFEDQLHNTAEGQNIALAYFKERGITLASIQKFGLGYSPNTRNALTQIALQKGYTLERLKALGLSVQYDESKAPIDRFRSRIIFPIHNLSGKCVGFGGRIMGNHDKTAKYLNSPESMIYSKSRELYGIYQAKQAIARQNKCYLVEGYTDVISMHQSGIENVISSSGTALTIEQIRLLKRFSEHITVLYDGDAAGIKAALRGIDLLLQEGLNIKVVLLPEGEDPDSFARKHSQEELLEFLNKEERDFIHFKINLYKEEMEHDPLRRAELIRDILRSIALIPDNISRSVLTQSTALELSIDEKVLIEELRKIRKAQQKNIVYQSQPKAPINPQQNSEKSSETPTPTSEKETSQVIEKKDQLFHFEHDLVYFLVLEAEKDLLIWEEEEEMDSKTGEIKTNKVLCRYKTIEYLYEVLKLMEVLDKFSDLFNQLITEINSFEGSKDGELEKQLMSHENTALSLLVTDIITKDLQQKSLEKKLFPQSFSLDIDLGQQILSLQGSDNKQEDIIKQEEEYKQERQEQEMLERGKKANTLLSNIQLHFLMQNILEVQREIIDAQKENQKEKVIQLLAELKQYNEEKKQLAKELGERTIHL